MLCRSNAGPSVARNHGLRVAAYDRAFMLDADTELIPQNIEYFYRASVETEATMLYGSVLVTEKEGSLQLVSHDTVDHSIMDGNYVDTMGIFKTARTLALGGFTTDPRIPTHEDYEFVLRLAVAGDRIVFVPRLLGRYYRTPLSLLDESSPSNPAIHRALRRQFDQRGTRLRIPGINSFIYDPELGRLG
jgi:glycosyltransferase involved in cell wall biosynthesis